MKDHLKILFILLAGITLSASPYLPANPVAAAFGADVRKKVGGGGGYTLKETFADSSANVVEFNSASKDWGATHVTPATSYTVTRIEFSLLSTGSPTGSVTAYVWTDDGSGDNSRPTGAPLATSTTTVVANSIPGTIGWIAFDFSGLALTGSTKYQFGFSGDGGFTSGNSVTWGLGSNFNASWETSSSGNGSSWATAIGGRQGYCRTYVTP